MIMRTTNAIAGCNVRRYRGRQQCRDVQLVQLDALSYEPASEETVFFFNFPFREALSARSGGIRSGPSSCS